MKIEKININDIKPASYNPNHMTSREKQKLKTSIKHYGYQDPIIINKRNNTIIAGNHRYETLKELNEKQDTKGKYDEIQVVLVDLDENDEKAFNIAHNKITGEINQEELENILIELDAQDYDLELTGASINLELPEVPDVNRIQNTKNIDTTIATYKLELTVENEKEQEQIYEEMNKRGIQCKLLIL